MHFACPLAPKESIIDHCSEHETNTTKQGNRIKRCLHLLWTFCGFQVWAKSLREHTENKNNKTGHKCCKEEVLNCSRDWARECAGEREHCAEMAQSSPKWRWTQIPKYKSLLSFPTEVECISNRAISKEHNSSSCGRVDNHIIRGHVDDLQSPLTIMVAWQVVQL